MRWEISDGEGEISSALQKKAYNLPPPPKK